MDLLNMLFYYRHTWYFRFWIDSVCC